MPRTGSQGTDFAEFRALVARSSRIGAAFAKDGADLLHQ